MADHSWMSQTAPARYTYEDYLNIGITGEKGSRENGFEGMLLVSTAFQGPAFGYGNVQTFLQTLSTPDREHMYNYAQGTLAESYAGRNVSDRAPVSPARVIYGRSRVPGVITYFSTDLAQGGQFLHIVLTYAYHQVEGIQTVYFNGEEVTFASSPPEGYSNGDWINAVFLSQECKGSTTQAADTTLVAQSAALSELPTWDANYRQRGFAHCYMRLFYNKVFFPNGFPNIVLDVKGKSDIYDPRDSSNSYTNNAALVIADYITNSNFGLGADYSTRIDETVLETAADICDESVSLTGGGTENRYEINGTFTTDEEPSSVLQKMRDAIGGDIIYVDGVWRIYPGKWRAPVLTLTSDDVTGRLSVQTMTSRRNRFNAVKGTFVSEDHEGQETDFPAVTNATYLSDDGGIRQWLDMSFPLVRSGAACQRLSKLLLEEGRQEITVNGSFSLKALKPHVGDNVYLTLDKYGWSAKAFKVVSQSIAISGSGSPTLGVQLTLKETASANYTWTAEEQTVDPAANSNLPDPTTVIEPENLALASGTVHLDIRADGTVFSRLYLSWDATEDPFVTSGGRYQIQYKKSSSGTWLNTTDAPEDSTSAYILDVRDGVAYDVRIRAINGLGFSSAWVTETDYTVIGKQEKPSNVSGFGASTGEYGIRLSWDKVSDLDIKHYEIQQGNAWDQGGDTSAGSGLNDFWISDSNTKTLPLKQAGSHKFLIKAVDTSELESTTASSIEVSIEGPSAPANLRAEVIQNTVNLRWDHSTGGAWPMDYYIVRRGSSGSSGTEELGTVKGTFKSYSEVVSGTYYYYVSPVDISGYEGEASLVSAAVQQAPEYVLKEDHDLDLTALDTLTNAVAEYDAIYAPLDTAGTFQARFTAAYTEPALDLTAANSEYLSVSSDTDLIPSAGFTVSVWVKLKDLSSDYSFLSRFKTTDDNRSFRLGLDSSNEQLKLEYSQDGAETSSFLNEEQDLEADLWCHVAARVDDDTGKIAIFVNGEKEEHYLYEHTIPAATLWLDAESGVSYDSSNRVSSWLDRSGNGITFTQSTDNYKPLYKTGSDGMNSKPAVCFDGSNDTMHSTALGSDVFSTSAKTFFIVCRQRADQRGVFLHCASGQWDLIMYEDSFGGDFVHYNYDGSYDYLRGPAAVLDEIAILEGRHEGGTLYLKKNGGSEYSEASGSTVNLAYALQLGATATATYFNGDISEVLAFDTALSASDRANIYNYLNIKYRAASSGLYAGDANLCVGADHGGSNPANAHIKALGYWGRALTDTEISNLFDVGAEQYADLSDAIKFDLIEYWDLDEESDGSGAVTRAAQVESDHDLTDNNTTPSVGSTTAVNFMDFHARGYKYFAEPTNYTQTAIIEDTVDLGVTYSGSIISVSRIENLLDGNSYTITPTLSWSPDDITYTAADAGKWRSYATNFRYIKLRLEISASTDEELIKISDLNIKADVKKESITRSVTAAAGDAGGTTINIATVFGKAFLDIEGIQATPSSSSDRAVATEWTDAANPESFDVWVWDSTGARADGTPTVTIHGFTNPIEV